MDDLFYFIILERKVKGKRELERLVFGVVN